MKLLAEHISKLEKEYDTLQEEVARGENSSFDGESVAYPLREISKTKLQDQVQFEYVFCPFRWWAGASAKMKQSTFVPEPQMEVDLSQLPNSTWLVPLQVQPCLRH